jgi:hypothetical protein
MQFGLMDEIQIPEPHEAGIEQENGVTQKRCPVLG